MTKLSIYEYESDLNYQFITNDELDSGNIIQSFNDNTLNDISKLHIINELNNIGDIGRDCNCGSCFCCKCLTLYEKLTNETSEKSFIRRCSYDGLKLFLPSMETYKIDRSVYNNVKKIFEEWDGKYKTSGKYYEFKTDINNYLNDYLDNNKATNIKKEFQFFETPTELAERMVNLAEVTKSDKILEPSAGRARIAWFLKDYNLDVIELNESNRQYLQENNFNLVGDDFIKYNNHGYNKIIMNPPFTKNQDVKHILHAYDLLDTGGIIVSIASAGVRFKQDKNTTKLRELCDTIEDLPPKTFNESGTNVNTVLLIINK